LSHQAYLIALADVIGSDLEFRYLKKPCSFLKKEKKRNYYRKGNMQGL